MWGKQENPSVFQTAPQFVQPLPGNLGDIEEGEFLHLEGELPTLVFKHLLDFQPKLNPSGTM